MAATNKRGIFALLDVRERQGAGVWSTRGDVWLTPSPFMGPSSVPKGFANGYFSGGYQPSNSPSFPSAVYYSTVARIDYSSDTTTVPARGSFPHTRSRAAGFGNQNFGYNAGGYVNGTGLGSSVVDRIDYSNDSSSPSPKGNLAFDKLNNLLGTGNESFGYAAGGYGYDPSVGPIYRTTIQRIDYSSDTSTAAQKGNLATNARDSSGTGNQSFGYYAGGTTHPFARISTVQRVDYSNDTATAAVKGPLSDAHRREIGAAGNADFGYFMGGYNAIPGSNTWVTIVDRVDYSNDTATASPKGPLSQSRSHACGTGDQSFGYVGGGEGNNDENMSSLERVDYSNDTATSVVRGPLIYSLRNSSASSSKQNANPVQSLQPASSVRENVAPQGTDFGYFAGGYNSNGPVSIVDRIDYSNDTATASSLANLSLNTWVVSGTGNANFGYFIGGENFPAPQYSTINRVDYSNDTLTSSVSPLPIARSSVGATGNNNFGYVGGGRTPSNISTVDRIDYSNDAVAASPKGPLSLARAEIAAVGNQSFGYFCGSGGLTSPKVSTIDRIDYSNDTATASPKGPLSLAKGAGGATGNADFGYYAGGGYPSDLSTVDRIDYSNDTATASVKGPLSEVRSYIGGTGNSSSGYFGGRHPQTGSDQLKVQRIDYSNDTATAVAKGPLSVERYGLAATSSRENAIPLKGPGNLEVPVSFGNVANPLPDFGYFANGYPGPGTMTTVDRIDYSNDTATAEYKSSTTVATYLSNGAASNHTHAYFMGGFADPANISNVERMSFTNGSTMPVPKGPLVYSRRAHFGVSNLNFAYNGGGYGTAPSNAKIDRVNFSNDTSTSVEKGALSAGGAYMSASGNGNFGYAVGSNKTLVQRIDYSNDTATAPSVANLTYTKNHAAALGNANFGYFGGGNQNTTYLERIDYSNDTATVVTSSLRSNAKDYPGSTGSSSFGYIAGGSPGTISSIDRIDFANDTASVSPKGSLSDGRGYMRAASPKEYGHAQFQTLLSGTYATPNTGYFAGGTPGPKSTVDRIDYSNDTVAAVAKGSLPPNTQRERGGGTSSGTHGYFAAGLTPASPSSTIVDRVDYVNDTVTLSNKGPLSLSRNAVASVGNANFGYFIGGGSINSPYIYSSMDRVDYSNDVATASIKGQMTGNRTSAAATGNQDFGYIGGGSNTGGSNVDRMDYANDTATALAKGDLSVARSGFLSAAGNASFGYFGGGPSLSSVDRVDYASDTVTASPKGSFTINRYGSAGTGDANFGYFGGGSPGPNSSVDRVDYSNDTATASPKGPLSAARHYLSGTSARENGFVPIGPSVVSNAPVQTGLEQLRGYIFGGSGDPSLSPAYNQPTQRIDFTNDTATAVVRGAPAGGLYYNFAVGNTNYAYAANLGNSSPASVQRFDYSNETAALVFRGAYNTVLIGAGGPTSSVGGYNASATGNHDYGWTNGGYKLYSVPAPTGYYESFSQIDRIDYSNDTANASRRSYTTNRFGVGSATGTNSYGYWIGGSASMPSTGKSTKVDRTDYASDTTNAVAKGNLTTVHGRGSDSIGNSSYAWVAGGRPWDSTIVDRIDYSNDTATAVAKGPLSFAISIQSTTGNQSYGYFCGGLNGGTVHSIVQRVDYSNDTPTASPKGPLVYKNYESSGASTTYNSLPST